MKDAPAVDELVAALVQADPETMNREQQLAFYINSYNLLAVTGIVAGRSPASLLGRARFFRFSTYQLGDERLSLQALEHERILPLAEPRIHFAIVCASLSCPKLRSEAYSAEQLERQLTKTSVSPGYQRFLTGIAKISRHTGAVCKLIWQIMSPTPKWPRCCDNKPLPSATWTMTGTSTAASESPSNRDPAKAQVCNKNVTGPSFTRLTFISAPNRPQP